MKILVFCAKGFETMEFSVFIDVMGWAGNDFQCPVSVDTCGFTKTVSSTFGVPVVVDKTIDEIVADDNIITSYCPETAPDVAFELLKKLCGDEKMFTVRKAMGYVCSNRET